MCQRVFRNFDPSLRTQEKAVEYVRALNAAKMEKIFARPFVGAMDGHIDSVSCMAKNPNHLKGIFSGSMDGGMLLLCCLVTVNIRLWDIASRYYLQHLTPYSASHHVIADNLSVSWPPRCCTWSDSVYRWTYSCIMWYRLHQLAAYVWKNAFWAVDHQCDGNLFATAGAQVDIWDHNRSQPVNSFEWGKDTVISVRFNPGEPNVLATSANDRSIAIYDLRMSSPTTKLIMRANEDCSCYSYDARKLDEAKCVHKDHVSAVMDIDYSPTGREFVTGSYDRTIRIFQYNGGHSREIYHTKRMQRVFCVKFSCDGSYVISGSDDANLRLWKANASEQLGVILLYQSGCIITRIPTLLQLLPRERKNHEYREAVKNRYKHLPEVKRIVRHRHLLKPIFKASALRRIMIDAERKKDERRRAHSAPGSIPRESIRKKRIIKEIE
ncbi:hypothetical protein RHGRI_011410 [Rhododendron griersonianum]|uniref:Sof1-like protein domain-containing protein n=1 Tax=Rhododendron griersonianum TaxID=479676 RepID=A0AAV6KM06_9ERIC|nr:hypothetical protein RHGRI_011410 [Rhododendron griersonianum]